MGASTKSQVQGVSWNKTKWCIKMNIRDEVYEALRRLTEASQTSTSDLLQSLVMASAAALPMTKEETNDAVVQSPSSSMTSAADVAEAAAADEPPTCMVIDECTDRCCAASPLIKKRKGGETRVSAASCGQDEGDHAVCAAKQNKAEGARQVQMDTDTKDARTRAVERGFSLPRKKFATLTAEQQSARLSYLLLELRAHAEDLGEDLEVGDCMALHALRSDKTASKFVASSPELQRLKDAWQAESIDEYKATLSMSGDEALYLKDQMMTSYESWDLMRRMSGVNSVWPGGYALKALAKEYNNYLAERLGLVRTEKTGYRVDIHMLHEWIVEQQLLAGVPAHKIPKKIKYKLSLDGSQMGSRDVELVALVPLNLGVAAQSLHAVYPLALYEGKEKREELEKDLGYLSAELRVLEQKQLCAHTARIHSCEFILCADLFALAKVMRASDGNGSCPCCGGERSKNQGWADHALEVWERVPDDDLPQNLFGLPLRQCVFCLLHMKVRVVGTLLKHMAREIENKKEALDEFEVAIQGMVHTFKLTRAKEKKNKKVVKSCYVSAMQGEQIDKIMRMVRNEGKVLCPQKNGEIYQDMWGPVMAALRMQTTAARSDKWAELWSVFVELYDTMNSHVKVNEKAVSEYEISCARFSHLFSGGNGVAGLKSLKDVTPYIHILVNHSAAYLREFGSLRDLGQEGFEAAHKRTKQFYAKTNMGGGKDGDLASAHKQVLLKLFRHQYLALKTRRQSKSKRRLNAMDRVVLDQSDKYESRRAVQQRARLTDNTRRYRNRLINKQRLAYRNKAVHNGRNELRRWQKNKKWDHLIMASCRRSHQTDGS
jgi:hypothetical protein